MKIEIKFQNEPDRAKEQLNDFLTFLESKNPHKLIIKIELTEKERLALEFYAYQQQVEVVDIIESAFRAKFDRFFQSL